MAHGSVRHTTSPSCDENQLLLHAKQQFGCDKTPDIAPIKPQQTVLDDQG